MQWQPNLKPTVKPTFLSTRLYPEVSQWYDNVPPLETFINIVPYRSYMPEEKKRSGKKISAWILQEMYDKLVSVGYNSPTEAIMKGLDLLLKEFDGVQIKADGRQEGTPSDTRESLEYSAETRELRARVEELQEYNETLKKELDKAGQDKDDIKKTFDNYMVQVQTLINQKAIEAPGAKKHWWQFW